MNSEQEEQYVRQHLITKIKAMESLTQTEIIVENINKEKDRLNNLSETTKQFFNNNSNGTTRS